MNYKYTGRAAKHATVLIASVLIANHSAAADVFKATLPVPIFLELPRLKTASNSPAPRMVRTKFTTDKLLPGGTVGAKVMTHGSVKYLAIEPTAEWSRPLRGAPSDVTFVSFLVNASVGTQLEIGGAQLSIGGSSRTDHAEVTAAGCGLSYSVPLELHNGVAVAALPVFTLRLDPGAGVWDLYAFDRLIAPDVRLGTVNGSRTFTVRAGPLGAAVCGLVLADENPLYVDINANGIDDVFEKTKRNGSLLGGRGAVERSQLAQAFMESQRAHPGQSWGVRRLAPDGFIAKTTAP